MTDSQQFTEVEFEPGDVRQIIDLAREGSEVSLSENVTALLVPNGYRLHVHDVLDAEAKHQAGPPRKQGTVHVRDVDSFVRYVGEHGPAATSTLYAGEPTADSMTVIGVLNGHDRSPDGEAGWSDHRVVLTLATTDEWRAWTTLSGVYRDQEDFAEFIEDHVADVVEPSAATMLEMARSFQAKTNVAFRSAVVDQSGQISLGYEETVVARAGEKGKLMIPERIALALQPFESSDRYKVEARFRYRLGTGNVKLAFVLDRPDLVIRVAFTDALAAIEEGTGLQPLRGTPA